MEIQDLLETYYQDGINSQLKFLVKKLLSLIVRKHPSEERYWKQEKALMRDQI